jgi:uncharacterized protein DUF3592
MALIFIHLWAFLFIIPGVFMVFYSIRNAIKGHASRSWQTTQCTILRSYVQVDTMGRPNRKAMMPSVGYDYQFNGETLKGSQIRYGTIGRGTRAGCEKVLQPYPEGAIVQLYVNPEDPHDCALEPGMPWGNVFNLVAGVIFIACGYALFQVKK